MNPLIWLSHITFSYTKSNNIDIVISDLSLKIYNQEILCIVGESGCGKTTLAKIICRLLKPTNGEINFSNELVNSGNSIQILFQNSDELLNPSRRVIDILNDVKTSEGFLKSILNDLNISELLLNRSCSAISGGERQRVALARVLLTQPKVLILDEPFSAQDVESKENFKIFLDYINKHNKMTLIVITHDISLIQDFADRIAVLYGGKVLEISPTNDFLDSPKHPYSRFLLSSTKYESLINTIDFLSAKVESYCPYYKRCNRREELCTYEVKELHSKNGYVFCNKPLVEVE